MAETPTEHWRRYELAHLRLSIDVFDDLSALTTSIDDQLTSLVQEVGPVRIVLWAGLDQTLDSWRKRLNLHNEAHFEAETDAVVCGRPARKQVAIVNQAGAVGSFVDSDGTIGHIYGNDFALVHICTSFSHEGNNILQCWIIDKDLRAAHSADESRYFASVRCR